MDNKQKAMDILTHIKQGNQDQAKTAINAFLFGAAAESVANLKKEMAKTLFASKK